jgi:hypothetical protein
MPHGQACIGSYTLVFVEGAPSSPRRTRYSPSSQWPLRDTITSAYIMFLHRRHASQQRIERLQRRHFSRQLSVRQRRRASASSWEAKIPSAEAARAAPASFMALPRVMAPLSRSTASWSSEAATCWSLLMKATMYPPYAPFPVQSVIRMGEQDGFDARRRDTPKDALSAALARANGAAR